MSGHTSRRAFLLLPFVLLPFALGCGGHGTRLEFNKGELFYTKSVSKAEAEKLGQYLVRQKFFDGQRKSVQLNKSGDTYEFRMVVKPEFVNNADALRMYGIMASEVSLDVFDKAPVVIHVCDERLKTLKTVEQNSILEFKSSRVYCTSRVEKAEAQKLGEYLTRDGFFDGAPKTVQLDKEGNTYLFRLTVLPGFDANPEFLAGVKEMRATMSQKVFDNKPLTIHVCNLQWQTTRTVTGD